MKMKYVLWAAAAWVAIGLYGVLRIRGLKGSAEQPFKTLADSFRGVTVFTRGIPATIISQ